MTVWVVTEDDGNVCCPSEEIKVILTSGALAEEYIRANKRSLPMRAEEWLLLDGVISVRRTDPA